MPMMTAGDLNLVGGHLTLNFVNTVWWHEAEEPRVQPGFSPIRTYSPGVSMRRP